MSCLIQHEDHDSIVFIKEQMDSKDLVFNFHNVSTDTIKNICRNSIVRKLQDMICCHVNY